MNLPNFKDTGIYKTTKYRMMSAKGEDLGVLTKLQITKEEDREKIKEVYTLLEEIIK